MEAIKAILYSSYNEIELWINDLLRLFTEPTQFDYLVGTLRALDPKKTITLRSGANGLISMDDLRGMIVAGSTCRAEWAVIESEISHTNPSASVPVEATGGSSVGDIEANIQHQRDIKARGSILQAEWETARELPSHLKAAVERGAALPYVAATATNFRSAAKKSKEELHEEFPEAKSLHDASTTEKGSAIVTEGCRVVYQQSSELVGNDVAIYLRNSEKEHTKNPLGVPTHQLSRIYADIEKRRSLGLIAEDATITIIHDNGCKRKSQCNKGLAKLVDLICKRRVRHVFTAMPNRINEDSIAVQTFLGAESIIPDFKVIFSYDTGKDPIAVAGKEDERRNRRNEATAKYKASIASIESSSHEVTADLETHNLLKKISGMQLRKSLLDAVESINATTIHEGSFIPFSTMDAETLEQMKQSDKAANEQMKQSEKEEANAREEARKVRREEASQTANEEAELLRQKQKQLVSEEEKLLEETAKLLQTFAKQPRPETVEQEMSAEQRRLKRNEEKGLLRAQKEKAEKLRLERRRLKKLEEKAEKLRLKLKP